MINLYQMLQLSPYASENEIRTALQQKEAQLTPQTIKAVHEWLLKTHVRARYDAKLQRTQPEFFAQFTPKEATPPVKTIPLKDKPKIVPKTAETEYDDDYMDLPPLWNPKVAMYWSILFNVIFGALVHAKNWERLNEKELAKQNYIVAVVGAIILAATTITIHDDMTCIIIGIIMTLAWYQVLGKKQVDFFQQNFQNDYEQRSWVLPIIIAIIAWMVWVAIVVVIVVSIMS